MASYSTERLTAPSNKRSSLEWYSTQHPEDQPNSLQRPSSGLFTVVHPLEDPDEVDDVPSDITPPSFRHKRVESVGGPTPEALPSISNAGETKSSPLQKKSFQPSDLFGAPKRKSKRVSFETSDLTQAVDARRKRLETRKTMNITVDSSGNITASRKKFDKRKTIDIEVDSASEVEKPKKRAPPPIAGKMKEALKKRAADAKRKTLEAHQAAQEKKKRGPLTPSEIFERTTKGSGSMLNVVYCWRSQRGYYPGEPYKRNQDACLVLDEEKTNGFAGYFGVYDGHGKSGDKCAEYVRDTVPKLINISFGPPTRVRASDSMFDDKYSTLYTDINEKLHRTKKIDDALSGTTAASAWIEGNVEGCKYW